MNTPAIKRFLARTPDGRDFYFLDSDRAERFAGQTGGTFHGLVKVPLDRFPSLHEIVEKRAKERAA